MARCPTAECTRVTVGPFLHYDGMHSERGPAEASWRYSFSSQGPWRWEGPFPSLPLNPSSADPQSSALGPHNLITQDEFAQSAGFFKKVRLKDYYFGKTNFSFLAVRCVGYLPINFIEQGRIHCTLSKCTIYKTLGLGE